MEHNENNSNELKVIQLAADTYAIQHPCILSEMKTVRIGEDLSIIYSNNTDPIVYPSRLLDLWHDGNVLYLKLWNYQKNIMQMYLQDLNKDECLFLFVSIPFITQLIKIMTCKSYHEISQEVLTKTN